MPNWGVLPGYQAPQCRLSLEYYFGSILPSPLLKACQKASEAVFSPLQAFSTSHAAAPPGSALIRELGGQGRDGWVVPRVSKFNTGPEQLFLSRLPRTVCLSFRAAGEGFKFALGFG